MGDSIIWILAAFVIYLLFMVVIGMIYAKRNENAEDYFLGGRKLSGAVAALSGIRYERMASDGAARFCLCAWDRAVVDCHRPVRRHSV